VQNIDGDEGPHMRVVDWLLKNKEWLFSGGGLMSLSLIWRMIANNFTGRSKAAQPQLATAPSVHTAQTIVLDSSTNIVQHLGSRHIETQPSGDEIARIVSNAPTFQRSQVGTNYVGLVVSWPVTFFDLYSLDGTVCKLILAYGVESWGAKIELTIDIDKYPRLKSAHGAIDQILRYEKPKFMHGWLDGKIVECEQRIVVEPTNLEFFD
jgi:hypothetical protein